MRPRIRLVAVLLVLIVATFTVSTKVDMEEEAGSCTDRCDRNYIACCQQSGQNPCPMSCQNEQITCYGKCNSLGD